MMLEITVGGTGALKLFLRSGQYKVVVDGGGSGYEAVMLLILVLVMQVQKFQ